MGAQIGWIEMSRNQFCREGDQQLDMNFQDGRSSGVINALKKI